MEKKWFRNWVVILSLIAAFLTIANSFYDWVAPENEIHSPGFVCPDGILVSVPENCAICNEDGICQDKENCVCEDCKMNVDCIIERTGEQEYLLILNEKKRVEGEFVKVTEISKTGSIIIEVEGIVRNIGTTRKEEIVDGLRIMTQEIIYNNKKPDSSMVIAKIEKYVPQKDEYLFNLNENKIIGDTEIRLAKVPSKANYILLDIGENFDEKINEGVEELIGGFNITLIKAYHQSVTSESYATIKLEQNL